MVVIVKPSKAQLMAGELKRYRELGIAESLPKIYRYPIACRELSFILRGAYSKLHKESQSLVFRDTLAAFRLFPQMQTESAVSAANMLAQAAEAALPKQKNNLAAKEFKHAKIAHKRQSKMQQEVKDCAQLPQDVLTHIMSFLDFQSVVSAGLVCRSWNLAAGDDSLWQGQYTKTFGQPDASLKNHNIYTRTIDGAHRDASRDETTDKTSIDWREAFKKAYTRESRWRLLPHQVGNYILGKASTSDRVFGRVVNNHIFDEESTSDSVFERVVKYHILHEFSTSDSESDSDTGEGTVSRLWAPAPRRS